MRPIFEKTLTFKDENNNFAINEECLHQMFFGLARRDVDDPTKKLYMYEDDIARRLPIQVRKHMKLRN